MNWISDFSTQNTNKYNWSLLREAKHFLMLFFFLFCSLNWNWCLYQLLWIFEVVEVINKRCQIVRTSATWPVINYSIQRRQQKEHTHHPLTRSSPKPAPPSDNTLDSVFSKWQMCWAARHYRWADGCRSHCHWWHWQTMLIVLWQPDSCHFSLHRPSLNAIVDC